MPARARVRDPHLVEMASQRMAVVRTVGEPNAVGGKALPALYGAVYTLKFALKKQGDDFKIGALRARWPNAHLAPKDEWVGHWALPVPPGTVAVTPKIPGVEVIIEDWEYGTVAEVMHVGPFATEGSTVERLHAFVTENGYELAGAHEEEYLTRPEAKVQKTIIRYPVRKRNG